MEKLIEGTYFDLLIYDLELLDFYKFSPIKETKKHLPYVTLILLSNNIKNVLKSFEYSIFRFILKDEISEQFPATFKDAIHLFNSLKKISF